MAIYPEKTSVILIGAASFQKSNNLTSSPAFLEAKDRVYTYFKDRIGVNQSNFLDLFNSELSADDQDNNIATFIEERVLNGISDMFVYYVGHGGFTPIENAFYLAIKNTRDNNPSVSSITIRTLANTILKFAYKIRTFFILDCCFAAAANTGFMSGGKEVYTVQLTDAFPIKGVSILCATSKNAPALFLEDRNITMFTEGLDFALKTGDSSVNSKFLSLRQIYMLTYAYIKQKNPENAVKPEILSPIQTQDDLADLPHFENFGFGNSRYDIIAKKRAIESEIINNNLANIGSLFIDFVRDFDTSGIYNNESIILCSECNDLNDEKEILKRPVFRDRKKALYLELMGMIDKILKKNIDSNI